MDIFLRHALARWNDVQAQIARERDERRVRDLLRERDYVGDVVRREVQTPGNRAAIARAIRMEHSDDASGEQGEEPRG
jgi:hypothetical protein